MPISPAAPRSVEELTQRNIETILQLEAKAGQDRFRGEVVIRAITEFLDA